MRRHPIEIVVGVASLAVVALALWWMSALDHGSSAPAAEPTFRSQLELQDVPKDALDQARGEFNAYTCEAGVFDVVTTSGATTLGEVDGLIPAIALGEATPNLPDSTPIYGAVVQGDCRVTSEEPYRAIQGYFLFSLVDQQMRLAYGRTWPAGSEPQIHSPFGPEANEALSMG